MTTLRETPTERPTYTHYMSKHELRELLAFAYSLCVGDERAGCSNTAIVLTIDGKGERKYEVRCPFHGYFGPLNLLSWQLNEEQRQEWIAELAETKKATELRR